MFCDGCGVTVDPGQPFCSRCGKQLAAAPQAWPARSRVRSNMQTLGILWIVYSAFHAGAVIIGAAVGGAMLRHLALPFDAHILAPFIAMVGFMVVIKSLCGLVVGWGLLRRQPWARVFALVMAFISLIHLPFGTALGIYTLVVLMPAEAAREYEAICSGH